MKNTISIVAALIIAVMFTACSKDQKVVRQLDGTWSVKSMSVDGENMDKEDYENTTYTFEKCKVSKNDCPGSISEDGFSFPFTYSISEKGETITFKYNFLGFTFNQVGTILEHSNETFSYRYTEDSEVIHVTLAKK